VRVWLRNVLRVRKKKDRDLFVWDARNDARNIDSAVNAVTRWNRTNRTGEASRVPLLERSLKASFTLAIQTYEVAGKRTC
jgi:hypothetical protein